MLLQEDWDLVKRTLKRPSVGSSLKDARLAQGLKH